MGSSTAFNFAVADDGSDDPCGVTPHFDTIIAMHLAGREMTCKTAGTPFATMSDAW